MPPKRKSIGGKSLDTTMQATKYTPSPQVEKRRPKRNAGVNKISPAKPSRLQPSQPLHMTTRRAASKVATNSTAGSIASVDSRRSSLDDTTQIAGGVDIDADRPTKKARLSDRSSTTTGTRSAVRRRQSPTPDPVASNQDIDIPDIVATPEPSRIEEPERVTSLGDESVADGRQDDGESDVQRLLSPLPKRRGRRPKIKRATTPTGSVAESLAAGTPLNGELQENGTDRDAPKTRRLPGRRRAPNADPLVEACLRRQLQLRIGHRAVSKALKPVLIELARRTVANLERKEDEEEFMEVEKQLTAELERQLQARLKILNNERRIMTDYYRQKLERDREDLRTQYDDAARKLQEDYDVRTENRILELARQYEHERDEDATDNEDGTIILPLHGRPTLKNPTGRLNPRFDSRSRFFLETERLTKARELRMRIGQEQEEALLKIDSDEDDDAEVIHIEPDQFPDDFGAIDEVQRSNAIEALNVHTLARATTEVEKEALLKETLLQLPPVPTNAEATGLQLLVTATEIAQNPVPPAFAPPPKQIHYQQPPSEPAPVSHSFPSDHGQQAYQTPSMQNGNHPLPEQHQQFYPTQRLQTAFTESASQQFSPIAASPTTSYSSHSRTASDSAAMAQKTPQQSPRHKRVYSTSAASPENPFRYQPTGERNHIISTAEMNELSPHLRRILHPTEQEQQSNPGNGPSQNRQHRSIWQNILDESKASASPTDETRRRSETSIIGANHNHSNHQSNHVRKISVPTAGGPEPLSSISEWSPNSRPRSRSPPRQFAPGPPIRESHPPQGPWRNQNPPPQPPPPVPSNAPRPPPPSMYYQHPGPQYPPPGYSNYQPQQHGPQQQPPPPPGQQQHPPGPFFGPPPPPQFHPPGQYPYQPQPPW